MKTAFLLLAVMIMAGTAFAADYGAMVRFVQGKTLTFPDCELTFTGTRKVSSKSYPRGFVYYDFNVSSGGKTTDVSWSSGTGDIGPEFFQVNGKKFVLELSHSEALKSRLKNEELVLWRQADFRK